jgi:hypothetical protein
MIFKMMLIFENNPINCFQLKIILLQIYTHQMLKIRFRDTSSSDTCSSDVCSSETLVRPTSVRLRYLFDSYYKRSDNSLSLGKTFKNWMTEEGIINFQYRKIWIEKWFRDWMNRNWLFGLYFWVLVLLLFYNQWLFKLNLNIFLKWKINLFINY